MCAFWSSRKDKKKLEKIKENQRKLLKLREEREKAIEGSKEKMKKQLDDFKKDNVVLYKIGNLVGPFKIIGEAELNYKQYGYYDYFSYYYDINWIYKLMHTETGEEIKRNQTEVQNIRKAFENE